MLRRRKNRDIFFNSDDNLLYLHNIYLIGDFRYLRLFYFFSRVSRHNIIIAYLCDPTVTVSTEWSRNFIMPNENDGE